MAIYPFTVFVRVARALALGEEENDKDDKDDKEEDTKDWDGEICGENNEKAEECGASKQAGRGKFCCKGCLLQCRSLFVVKRLLWSTSSRLRSTSITLGIRFMEQNEGDLSTQAYPVVFSLRHTLPENKDRPRICSQKVPKCTNRHTI